MCVRIVLIPDHSRERKELRLRSRSTKVSSSHLNEGGRLRSGRRLDGI